MNVRFYTLAALGLDAEPDVAQHAGRMTLPEITGYLAQALAPVLGNFSFLALSTSQQCRGD